MSNTDEKNPDASVRLSVCIPAYGRPDEYALLLQSIKSQLQLPYELLICEDGSPQRDVLRDLTKRFANELQDTGLVVRFVENTKNLGYDGNLRRLIELATGTHVFFIGNDDYILPEGLKIAHDYMLQHQVLAASRSFARFHRDPLKPVGYSRQLTQDSVLNQRNCSAGLILRIGGFFGGLVFDRRWAASIATDRYDGTLYYQIYLLLEAFAIGSVGYMSEPTVAARAGNAPLFGSAEKENQNFTPGSYSARARGKMWESILMIAQDTELKHKISVHQSVQHELATKMSFHVFEMFAGRSKQEQCELRKELIRLNLFNHWMPKVFFFLNVWLGSLSPLLYRFARRTLQR